MDSQKSPSENGARSCSQKTCFRVFPTSASTKRVHLKLEWSLNMFLKLVKLMQDGRKSVNYSSPRSRGGRTDGVVFSVWQFIHVSRKEVHRLGSVMIGTSWDHLRAAAEGLSGSIKRVAGHWSERRVMTSQEEAAARQARAPAVLVPLFAPSPACSSFPVSPTTAAACDRISSTFCIAFIFRFDVQSTITYRQISQP